jgi:hypothetical protein
VDRFFNFLVNSERWKDFQLDGEQLYGQLKAMEPFNYADGLRCFYASYAQRFGKKRWGDKTPPYILAMTGIQAVLPEARFIHIIRDGRDVAVSLKKMWWGPKDDIVDQAANWMSRIHLARLQAENLEYYLEINYPDLILKTTETLKKICEFIELPYDPRMEMYYRRSQSRLDEINQWNNTSDPTWDSREKQLTIFELTQKPPDRSRLGIYRKELTSAEIATYERIAENLLKELGFELQTDSFP